MTLGPSLKRLMKDKFDRWEAESVALEERIAQAKQFVATEHIHPTAAVNAISRRFKQWADSMDGLPPSGIRKVLANVVSKLNVDLETRHVRMELSLRDGMTLSAKSDTKPPKEGEEPVCLVASGPSPSLHQAHRLASLKIAVVDCEGQRGSKNVPWCFTCRRRAA
jgi:hypothetical protein